jgi:hypothetical protein
MKLLEACRLKPNVYQQVLTSATAEYSTRSLRNTGIILDMDAIKHSLELIPMREVKNNRRNSLPQTYFAIADPASQAEKIQEKTVSLRVGVAGRSATGWVTAYAKESNRNMKKRVQAIMQV